MTERMVISETSPTYFLNSVDCLMSLGVDCFFLLESFLGFKDFGTHFISSVFSCFIIYGKKNMIACMAWMG